MKKFNFMNDTMSIGIEEKKYINEVFKASQFSIFNSEIIDQFQKKFNTYLDSTQGKVICLPNCTTAIYLALKLLEIKDGDNIIVPNLTHSSSIYPILNLKSKCKIKICDFDKNSNNLSIKHLEKLVNKHTKALIVCYLHGYPNNIFEILEFCKNKNITLIEDAAQGLGVKILGQNVGTFGDYSCFSFGENKLLRMGEGGALRFSEDKDLNIINKFRHVGEVFKRTGQSTIDGNVTYEELLQYGLDYNEISFNFRINTLNIAIGLGKLEKLNSIIELRKKKLKIYFSYLNTIEGIDIINKSIDDTAPISAWFVIDPEKYDINKLILKAIELGIPIGKFKYPLINEISYFENYIENKEDNFINSYFLQKNSLFLPLYENLSLEDIKLIAKTIKNLLLNYSEWKAINSNIKNKKIDYFDGFFIK